MSGGYISGGSGGHLISDNLAHDPFGMDNSQSYLGLDSNMMLRDTAIPIPGYGHNLGDIDMEARARFLASHSRFVCG